MKTTIQNLPEETMTALSILNAAIVELENIALKNNLFIYAAGIRYAQYLFEQQMRADTSDKDVMKHALIAFEKLRDDLEFNYPESTSSQKKSAKIIQLHS